jgi:hypothetical protein
VERGERKEEERGEERRRREERLEFLERRYLGIPPMCTFPIMINGIVGAFRHCALWCTPSARLKNLHRGTER